MSWKVGMPNLGHTMEEGRISQWLKKAGDTVTAGEVIAMVESDKASFEVESPADGVLLSIDVEDGSTVPVGCTIGLVGSPGETLQAPSPLPATGPTPPVAGHRPSDPPPAAPIQADRPARVAMSPAARRLAESLGADVTGLEGTGDGGLITREDVQAYAERLQGGSRPSTAAPLPAARRAIAEATTRAWQEIPHVTLTTHADVGALIDSGAKLTPAIARAAALGLAEHRAFNGWLVDGSFQSAQTVDLGIAIATPRGVMTAVVKAAERKSFQQLADEIEDAALHARAGTLGGARMVGGSFTISSLGRWGVDAFGPIISSPQVGVLGVGRLARVAREAEGGGVRFASEVTLSLVFDHRANDGVEAAQFLAAVVAQLEDPAVLRERP